MNARSLQWANNRIPPNPCRSRHKTAASGWTSSWRTALFCQRRVARWRTGACQLRDCHRVLTQRLELQWNRTHLWRVAAKDGFSTSNFWGGVFELLKGTSIKSIWTENKWKIYEAFCEEGDQSASCSVNRRGMNASPCLILASSGIDRIIRCFSDEIHYRNWRQSVRIELSCPATSLWQIADAWCRPSDLLCRLKGDSFVLDLWLRKVTEVNLTPNRATLKLHFWPLLLYVLQMHLSPRLLLVLLQPQPPPPHTWFLLLDKDSTSCCLF